MQRKYWLLMELPKMDSDMSVSLKPILHHPCVNELLCVYPFRVTTRFCLQKSKTPSLSMPHFRRLCSVTGDNNTSDLSDTYNKNHKYEGLMEKEETSRGSSTSNEHFLIHCVDVLLFINGMMDNAKLKRYGISGVLSYGLLNTAYYLTTFLVVWFYVAPAPGKMGYFAAAERFLKVMAMVWAGSQVTKLVRAGGGLSWFTAKFKFESQGKAFIAIVGFCFGLALTLFLVITLLWA